MTHNDYYVWAFFVSNENVFFYFLQGKRDFQALNNEYDSELTENCKFLSPLEEIRWFKLTTS